MTRPLPAKRFRTPLPLPAACAAAALLALLPASAEEAAPTFEWIPPQTMSDELRADDGELIIPEVTVLKTPMPTADASKFQKEYVIDLAKFGIHNDGTHAAETSAGLNAALQDAKAAGANRIVFPKGTYLIDETQPVVLNHRDTIVDLNGATLQIQTNGLPKYAVVRIAHGAENLRLTNGTLRGDRDTHDYKTDPGTHEWGTALRIDSGNNLEIDHLTLTNGSGDGASTRTDGAENRPELLAMIGHSVMLKDLEQGAFSKKGEKIPSTAKTRTIKPYDLTKLNGQFELGYMGGYMGFPFIKGRVYQVYFLDKDQKFLEMRKVLQYRTIKIPEGAVYAHLEFNQPEVSEEPAHAGAVKGGWLVRMTNFKPPRNVHFHHNSVTGNRRLGLAVTGGQCMVIEDNAFDRNGGTNPAYGVDFEDGAELTYDIVFRRNTFNGNINGDLVICAGTEILIEDNVFQKSVVVWGRAHNYAFRKNRFTGGSVMYATRTGIASIRENSYANCSISLRFDTKGVADGIVREPGKSVSTPSLLLEKETLDNVTKVEGTYLNFKNSKIRGTKFLAGEETRMASFVGCTFENSQLEFEAKGPQVIFVFKDNTGELPVSGPGLARKTGAAR